MEEPSDYMSISDLEEEMDPLDDLPSLLDSSVETINPVVHSPPEQGVTHITISSSESSFNLSSVTQHLRRLQQEVRSPPPLAQVSMSEV